MSTVKRKRPKILSPHDYTDDEIQWYLQCLQDLNAGRHAKDCGCSCSSGFEYHECLKDKGCVYDNACSEIVRCALEIKSYEVEAPDEVPR